MEDYFGKEPISEKHHR